MFKTLDMLPHLTKKFQKNFIIKVFNNPSGNCGKWLFKFVNVSATCDKWRMAFKMCKVKCEVVNECLNLSMNVANECGEWMWRMNVANECGEWMWRKNVK